MTNYVPGPDEDVFLYDFRSLYPSVNYKNSYPVGHPNRIYVNKEVHWASEKEFVEGLKALGLDFRGLFKILLEPCGNTLIPAVPYREKDK